MSEALPAKDSSSAEVAQKTPNTKAGPERPLVYFTDWLVIALMAGGLAWVNLQGMYPLFNVPENLLNLGPSATAEQELEYFSAKAKAERQNAIFFIGVLGALTSGGFGVAQAFRHRSQTGVLMGTVLGTAVGVLVGGLLGAAGGLLGDITCVALRTGQPLSLTAAAMSQCVTLGMVGVGVGLGLGLSSGKLKAAMNYLAFGLIAGVCAGFIYPVILALVLPGAQTEWALPPDGGNQAVWIAVASISFGLVMPRANLFRSGNAQDASQTATPGMDSSLS